MWGKVDQRDENAEEADNMHQENERLNMREQPREISVNEKTNEEESIEYQRPMPSLKTIFGIVQYHEALDHLACRIGHGCDVCLIADHGDPASQVAQELRA
jgi:hypothetical protein